MSSAWGQRTSFTPGWKSISPLPHFLCILCLPRKSLLALSLSLCISHAITESTGAAAAPAATCRGFGRSYLSAVIANVAAAVIVYLSQLEQRRRRRQMLMMAEERMRLWMWERERERERERLRFLFSGNEAWERGRKAELARCRKGKCRYSRAAWETRGA